MPRKLVTCFAEDLGLLIGTIKMLKQERAAFISKRLNEIYPETPVPLNHKDAINY